MRQSIKRQAVDTEETPQQVITEELRVVSDSAAVKLPFEHLADSMPDGAQPITDYFEDAYIGRQHRRGRRQPPSAHDTWSVHNRVEEGLPRTNNHVAGWHHRMQSNVGAYHPSIWHFLDVLRHEQSLNDVIITQIQAGQPAPPQRDKYKAVSQRIVTVVGDNANRPIDDFWRGITHNIQM